MKTKDQKYNEAVERNITSTTKLVRSYFKAMSISQIRHHLGIKKSDDSYDEAINSLR